MVADALCLKESASFSAVRDGVQNVSADVLARNVLSLSSLSAAEFALFPMCSCLLSNKYDVYFSTPPISAHLKLR
jgi:hypothetical protein